jgi:catechol 2,3-dioxygenase-like lactoylglutathione lyase family enzyme
MRLEHTALFAPDTTHLADWYCRHFQMTIVFKGGGEPPTYFVADRNGMCLEIMALKGPRGIDDTGRVFHLAFVPDDFEKACAELTAAGVTLEPEIQGPGLRLRYFYDPAGNRAQVIKRDKPLTRPA